MAEENAAPTNKKGLIAGIIAAVAVVVVIIVCILMSGPKVVGKYTLSAMIENGEEKTELVDLIKQYGGTYTIEFKKDKTGVLEMKMGDEGQTIEFKYDDKELKPVKVEEGENDQAIPYTYKDNTVTITMDDEGMKFTREK